MKSGTGTSMQAALLNSNRDVKLSSRQQTSNPMVPIDELDASESDTKTKGIEDDRDFEDEDEEQAFGRSNERVDLTKV
jgi:hypothetical protein